MVDAEPRPTGGEGAGTGGESADLDIIKNTFEARGNKTLKLVLNEMDRTNRDNIINEAVDKKIQKNVLAKIPVVSLVAKPLLAAHYRTKAVGEVRKTENLADVYDVLGLQEKDSKIISRDSAEQVRERARLALEESGFPDDEVSIDSSTALLQGESISKVEDATQKDVRDSLMGLFDQLKGENSRSKREKAIKDFNGHILDMQKQGAFGQDKDTAWQKFLGCSMVRYVIGDHTKSRTVALDEIMGVAEGVKRLSEESISRENLEKYLEDNLTLYSASMKEGLYTKQKVNNITEAAAKLGAVGAITYALIGSGGRREARAAAGKAIGVSTTTVAGAGIVGATMGGVFGAIRGGEQARQKVSKAEIEKATSAEAIEENGGAHEESSDDDDMSGDADDAERRGDGAGNINNGSRIARTIRWLGDKKRRLTGEEEHLAEIEKIRDRKSAKELYDELKEKSMIVELLGEEGDITGKFQELAEKDPEGLKKALKGLLKIEGVKGLELDIVGPNPDEERDRRNGECLRISSERGGKENVLNLLAGLLGDENEDAFLHQLLLNPKNAEVVKNNLLLTLEDIDARNKVSDSMNVDLISYSKGNVDKERYLLMRQVLDAKKLLGDRYDSEISKRRVEDAVKDMESRQKEANKEKRRFMARQALVDGVIGAAVGGSIGAAVAKGREWLGIGVANNENGEPVSNDNVKNNDNIAENVGDNRGGNIGRNSRNYVFEQKMEQQEYHDLPRSAELAVDKDGGYTVRINGKDVIGRGDEPGIEFTDRGLPTAESIERLKAAGIEIESTPEQIPLPGATKQVGINDFFNKENVGNDGLSKIAGRRWVVNNDGSPLYNTGNIHVGDNGDIIMQVTQNPGSDNLEGMKYFFTGNSASQSVGIFVDVQPDGTVVIPAGSPAASLFDGDKYLGVYAELTRQGADGKIDVFNTFGDGVADVNTITVPNPNAFDTVYTHVLKVDGQSLELNAPNSVNAESTLTNLIGHGSLKGTGEPIGYKATGGITELKTNSGEVVSVDRVEHYGGYDEAHDTFFHPDKYLDGANNSGASVVREMVGAEGEGLSSGEIDRIFMEKVNSGKISEGDVIEKYLENVAKSPESLVTTRAMMGNLRADIDGDGVLDLIDTEGEINILADMISRDPDGYDGFANDTLNMFYDKIAGGTIRFVDYSGEQFQYSTWAKYIGENVMQRLGKIDHPTNGIGIVFLDANGNSIYDLDTVRRLWRLPEGYKLEYIGDRLNCIQKTGRGSWMSTITTPPPTITTPPPTITTPPPTITTPPPTITTPPPTITTPPPVITTLPPKKIDEEIKNAGDNVVPEYVEKPASPISQSKYDVNSGNLNNNTTYNGASAENAVKAAVDAAAAEAAKIDAAQIAGGISNAESEDAVNKYKSNLFKTFLENNSNEGGNDE